MYVLALKSTSKPGRWCFIDRIGKDYCHEANSFLVGRDVAAALVFPTEEQAQGALDHVVEKITCGTYDNKYLTPERANTIEVIAYRHAQALYRGSNPGGPHIMSLSNYQPRE